MAFVFYDTETTGINTSFDQILQFAAIKTDADLNEIERFEIRSRLLDHVIPSPGAMHVTGATVGMITDRTLPSHYEMIRAIRERLSSWGPAIFLGYNSIDFDEHLLRQALYQTLHDPYLTNKNGNCRGDILKSVRAATVFEPDAIKVPLDDKGRPSFKLDRLAPHNGFAHINAHDALGDVEATIYIARLLRDRAPELWSSLLRFTNKTAAIEYLKSETIIALCESYFGKTHSYFVTFLGEHAAKPGKHAIFDLIVDPDDLASLTHAQLVTRLNSRPKPIRSLRVNAHPIFIPIDIALERLRPDVEEDEFGRRADKFVSDPDLRLRLLNAWAETGEPAELSPHVEEQIYSGFASKEDEIILSQFHLLEWENRIELVSKFVDNRLRTLGYRLIYSERRDILSPEIISQIENEIAVRLMCDDGSEKWNTIPKALREVEDFVVSTNCDLDGMRELREFILQLRERHASILLRIS